MGFVRGMHSGTITISKQPGARRAFAARHCLGIISFEDQLDIELCRGVIEAHQRANQRAEHVRFAVKRHQDGIDRKLVIGNAAMDNGIAQLRTAEEVAGGKETKGDHRHE